MPLPARPQESLVERRTAAVALWTLAHGAAVLGIGLGLSDAASSATSATSSAVACLIPTCLLALNAAGLWLRRDDADQLPSYGLPAVGLVAATGPVLAGFAWTPGGAVFPLVWCVLLLLASVAGAIVWSALRGKPAIVSSSTVSSAVIPRDATAQPEAPPCPGETETRPVEQARTPDVAAQAILSPVQDTSISLQLTRRLTGLEETIEIATRIEFLPGERQVSVHLPISPPLATAPEVECEPLDDGEIELVVGAVYPYGVRIDAKRPLPADAPLATSVAVLLTAPRPERTAA